MQVLQSESAQHELTWRQCLPACHEAAESVINEAGCICPVCQELGYAHQTYELPSALAANDHRVDRYDVDQSLVAILKNSYPSAGMQVAERVMYHTAGSVNHFRSVLARVTSHEQVRPLLAFGAL